MQTDPNDTLSSHEDAAAEALKASDPEAYAEIYGDLPADAGSDEGAGEGAGAGAGGQGVAAAASQEPAASQQAGDPAAAAAAAAGGGAAAPMVPLSRLNEVLAKVDSLTAQLERQQQGQNGGGQAGAEGGQAGGQPQGQQPPPAFDLAAKLREKQQAAWDGKEDRVIEIELEIAEYNQQQAVERIRQEGARAQQLNEFNATAVALVSEYPQLNTKVDGCNQEAVRAVQVERDIQLSAGVEPAKALRRAVAIVAAEFSLERVPPKTDAGAATTQQGAGGNANAITARQVDAARTSAQIAGTPPVGVGGTGEGDRQQEERPLSREEFAALDPKEKARRLGLA